MATDGKELRQFLIDTESLLREELAKVTQIRNELDGQTERKIEKIINQKFNDHARGQIVDGNYKLHKKVVKRLMGEIKKEVPKTVQLPYEEIIGGVKDLSEDEKLQLAEYTLQRLHLDMLGRKLRRKTRPKQRNEVKQLFNRNETTKEAMSSMTDSQAE